jgi:hypothetical protein
VNLNILRAVSGAQSDAREFAKRVSDVENRIRQLERDAGRLAEVKDIKDNKDSKPSPNNADELRRNERVAPNVVRLTVCAVSSVRQKKKLRACAVSRINCALKPCINGIVQILFTGIAVPVNFCQSDVHPYEIFGI